MTISVERAVGKISKVGRHELSRRYLTQGHEELANHCRSQKTFKAFAILTCQLDLQIIRKSTYFENSFDPLKIALSRKRRCTTSLRNLITSRCTELRCFRTRCRFTRSQHTPLTTLDPQKLWTYFVVGMID